MTPASAADAPAQAMTLGEAWTQTAQALARAELDFGHGCASADDEAAWIVLHAAGLPATEAAQFAEHADSMLSAEQVAQVHAHTTQRIATRQPLAYVLGEAWLVGLRFSVDARVIVPRSFIAELLDQGALDPWLPQAPRHVLDLCTGSGCLAILAALAWESARVDAIDLSADALAVAQINRAAYGLESRVQLVTSDLWSACDPVRRYDLVLCNPPYVPAASMASLPPEYRHEPAMALAGGDDGMDLIRRILHGAAAHLSAEGVMVLEVGNERAAFEAAFAQLPAVWLETELHPDAVCVLLAADLRAAFSQAAGA